MKPREYINSKMAYYDDIAKANEGNPNRWATRKLALRLARENREVLRRLDAENQAIQH